MEINRLAVTTHQAEKLICSIIKAFWGG